MNQFRMIKKFLSKLAKIFLSKFGFIYVPEYVNDFLVDPVTKKLIVSYADAPRVLDLLDMMNLPEEEYTEFKRYMEKSELTHDVILLHRFQKSILQFLFMSDLIQQDKAEKEYYLELNKVSTTTNESTNEFLQSISRLYSKQDYDDKNQKNS